MKSLFSLFAAAPAALIAPAQAEAPATAQRVIPARAFCADPLGEAAAAHARARRQGGGEREAMAAALEALAFADYAALDLNGPHTQAGVRVNRKAQVKARRVLAVLAASAERRP